MHSAELRRLPGATLCGLALACICLLAPIGSLVSGQHLWVYHQSGPLGNVVLALALDVLILTCCGTLLVVLSWSRPWLERVFWAGVAAGVPAALAVQGSLLGAWELSHRGQVATLLVGLVTWAGLALMSRRVCLLLRDAASPALHFMGVAALLLLGQMGWVVLEARNLNRPLTLHASGAGAGGWAHGRVIWIVLDELSYRAVYADRYPGLALPAFDSLAAQSINFTAVEPAAQSTEIAVPSMMFGMTATAVRSSADGAGPELLHAGAWTQLRPEESVFEDALRLGYRTAVAGWYNPYCRTLATVLDSCMWSFRGNFAEGLDPYGTVLHNMAAPVERLAYRARHVGSGLTQDPEALEARVADLLAIQSATRAALSDESLDFVFLHLPAPHPPGYFRRATGQFCLAGCSYVDNLVLADQTLAGIMQTLKDRSEWDSATVLVMGDHSWRVARSWRNQPGWTEEDEAASRGSFADMRPAYLVKLPGQTVSGTWDRPFAAVETKPLLDLLLRQEVHTPGELTERLASMPQDGRETNLGEQAHR